MPAGITSVTTPSSSDVLGVLSTKPKETPPTLGGGNWLTMGAWNKPPTGQTLTDYNAWLNRIGMPQNTFGQFMINPTTGQYALPNPTTPNAMGGINTSKPSYQTFPLYNQPQTPQTPTTPTTPTTPPPSIYTPDMPNYVGGETYPYITETTQQEISRQQALANQQRQTANSQPIVTDQSGFWQTVFPTVNNPINPAPVNQTPNLPNTPAAQGWMNAITKAGYNPTRMLGYYTRNRRIIP